MSRMDVYPCQYKQEHGPHEFVGWDACMTKCPGVWVPKVHEKVRKKTGYAFDSTIVSVFQNLSGDTRLVCESDLIPTMLHIFSLNQMERRDG